MDALSLNTIYRSGTRTGNVGIPGTGLSYRESLDNQATHEE